MTRKFEVRYVDSIFDPSVAEVSGDHLLQIAEGVYFHSRLQLMIIVKSDLPKEFSWMLPTN